MFIKMGKKVMIVSCLALGLSACTGGYYYSGNYAYHSRPVYRHYHYDYTPNVVVTSRGHHHHSHDQGGGAHYGPPVHEKGAAHYGPPVHESDGAHYGPPQVSTN